MPIGELAALGSALTWALNSALLRWLAPRADVVLLNALRCELGMLLILVGLLLQGRGGELLEVPLQPLIVLIVSVVLSIGVGDSLYFHSIRLVGLARAHPLSMSYPLVTAVLAMLLLGEQLSPEAMLGIVLVVVGVSAVATTQTRADRALANERRGWRRWLPAEQSQRLGIVYALAAAVCWSVGTIIMRPALEVVDIWVASVVRLIGAAVVLQLWAARHLPAVARLALKERDFLGGVLLLGVGTAVSLQFFLLGVAEAGAARGTALTSVSPLFSVVIAVAFLHEQVTWRLLTGVAITVAGAWLITLR